MLDEVWLQGVQFDSPYGRITGLAGIGSQHVAFNLTTPSGAEHVLKVMYPHLAFVIRELPPHLTLRPEYSVERLNRKLLHLVRNPLLDTMSQSYDDLYVHFVAALHKQGVPGLLQSSDIPRAVEATSFLLHTPGMQRRLQDMATLKGVSRLSVRRLLEDIPFLHFGRRIMVSRGIYDHRHRIVRQARRNLRNIELLSQISSEMQPEQLPENPLYTWGAAIMDGFFTDEELPQVAAFLTEHFGPLLQHPQANTFTKQIMQLIYLLEHIGQERVFRFVQLCSRVGLLPEGPDVLELPGEIYLERGQYQEALAIFKKALGLDDQNVKALALCGETYRQMGRYDEALTDLNRAIALDPRNVEAITYRGETYVEMKRFEDAMADFDQAITLDQESIEAIANRGTRYRELGRYDEALTDFNRASSLLELKSTLKQNPDIIFGRAITYRQMGRSQEALDDLNQVIALTIGQSNVEALVNRALIYAQNGEYTKALDDLDFAIFCDDRDARIFTIRGEIYVSLGNYKDALADFDCALALDGQNIQTIIDRGEAYALTEQYQEALTDFNQAIGLDPQNFRALANRGETYRVMERYQEALVDFEHALALDKQNTEIIARRNMTYQQIEHP